MRRGLNPRCRGAFALLVLLCTGGLGFAQEPEWGPWRLLLPFEHQEASKNAKQVHSPEDELSRMELDGPGPDLEREHAGKAGVPIRWRVVRDVTEWEPIPLRERLPSEFTTDASAENAAAYLHRTIRCGSTEQRTMMMGSDDSCRVWLNGKIVWEFDGPRTMSKLTRVDLPLEAGRNHLFVKVVNGGGAWGFHLRPTTEFTAEKRNEMQPAVNAAIDRGVDYLLKSQLLDGSWGYDPTGYPNGQTALSLYALMKSGVSPDHQAVRRGLAFLERRAPKKTYSNAVQILALASAKKEENDEWIEQLLELMLDWQDGDFAYPGGENDLSCTQYGAFAYWIASQRGLKVPKKAWTDLARSVLRYATEDGGFSYRPRQSATGSMTVAGLTVIALCRQGLGDSGFPRQFRRELERAEARGLDWLARKFDPQANPAKDDKKRKRWVYYYLYGVERLAALSNLELIGNHDWYWEGAEFLIGAQGDDGHWSTAYGEVEPNTCFALLFLNRATATATGPGASRAQGRHYATDGEDSKVVLRAKGDTPMSLWLSEIRPSVLETHARRGEAGEGLYLEAVEYHVDGSSVARVEADPEKPWRSEPYAIQHSFEARGEHEVQLELHFAKVGDEPRPESILSPTLKVRIDEKLEPWMLEYATDASSNLATTVRKEPSASSHKGAEAGKGNVAGKAFDGRFSSAWICDAKDPAPEVRVEFKKPIKFDQLVFTHAGTKELEWGDYDRAKTISVILGKRGKEVIHELDPDSPLKSVLQLEKPVKVSRLSVRVLDRVEGEKHPGFVGFTEIELRLGDKKSRNR